MSKLSRQGAILALVEKGPVPSQEELQRSLAKQGLRVGQATLSRDIRELRLIKTGRGYESPNSNAPGEPGLPPVTHLLKEFVLDVRPAQNLLVVKTAVGSAQPVAAALDAQSWAEVVGTIAGDDAILIVAPDKKSAVLLAKRIREMLA
ncbi:MAG TPA: ArgR family transcriptional regulator [Terriglobales bacterium]|nr:ArgR family transcriptional regulator [Terriglobales bacterium]